MSDTATVPAGQRRSFTATVGDIVAGKVRALQRGVLANESASVAALARLRRAAGKPPGAVPEVLQYTFDQQFVPSGSGDDVTPAEHAAHLALTFYALHQQAVPVRMHRDGHEYRFGRSARQLVRGELKTPPDPATRRFQALLTSTSFTELTHHSRGLIQRLRGNQIPLDYGLLAQDLMRWQDPSRIEQVRLAWGRDYFVRPPQTEAVDAAAASSAESPSRKENS